MSKRILVVEDQEDNRRIVRDLLSSAGFELIEATTGEEGIHLAESRRPDLILMDIQMPVLDGYEATRRIKATAGLQHIPIIVVTSYALSGDDAPSSTLSIRTSSVLDISRGPHSTELQFRRLPDRKQPLQPSAIGTSATWQAIKTKAAFNQEAAIGAHHPWSDPRAVTLGGRAWASG
jgi:two-component system, cell cycle response regulator DivK